MIRLGILALVFAYAGCKSETARKASRAADEVVEQRRDIVKTAHEDPERIPVEARELTQAEREFAERKRIRIAALRGEHSVIATQVKLIATLAESFPLTDAGRADVNDKLSKFELRLAEAMNHIDGLKTVDAEAWEARDEQVRAAMDTLNKARATAWDALEDAPRIAPNAS